MIFKLDFSIISWDKGGYYVENKRDLYIHDVSTEYIMGEKVVI